MIHNRSGVGSHAYAADLNKDGRARGAGRRYFGTSKAGLREKKPAGIILNPTCVTGITGHSSGRGMCVMPIVYHTTTSWLANVSLFPAHRVSPAPPRLWFG